VPAAADQPLAELLQLELLPALADQSLDPVQVLGALQSRPEGWLLPLALDPGAWLGRPLCWAEALGAWRQPCLLLVAGAAAGTGPDRATAALLRSLGVPLLGLVQWGGEWRPQERGVDGLPWLGWLPGADANAAANAAANADVAVEARLELRRRCGARWQQLSSAMAASAPPDPPAGSGSAPAGSVAGRPPAG
jgi:hypothetical protein